MKNLFEGQKLLVVGGTSGMGLAVAQTILRQGGKVVITGRRADKTEAARHLLASDNLALVDSQSDSLKAI